MLKKIVVSGLFLVVLAGCDGADVNNTSVVAEGASVQQENSVTALYLPGGSGIDFGRKPVSDQVIKDKVSKIRIAQYEFDEAYDVVDKSVASVLLSENYSRNENPLGNRNLNVTYRKAGAEPILARYSEIVQKGFSKKTILVLSWRF